LRHRKNPDWPFILSGGYFDINGKIFVPLHSWELTLILVMGLGFFTQNWILAFTTGVAHTTYQVRFLGYSLIFRALRAFEKRGFCVPRISGEPL